MSPGRWSISGAFRLLHSLNTPLEVTSFTIAPASLAANQLAVFTATHTGGTGPLHLFFGDDEGAVVTANAGTCSITHDYDSDDTFHVVVTVRGASTSDLQTIQFTITIP